MTQPKARFLVLAGETMLDLLAKMQTNAHPMAQLKYFGRNEGDYSQYENQELVQATQFIAVFDFAPVYGVELDNVEIVQFQPDSEGLQQVSDDSDIAMAA